MKTNSRNVSLACQYDEIVPGGHGCRNTAIVDRRGKTYCRVHDPDRYLQQARESANRGKAPRPAITIRIDPDVYHKARVAAVQEHKSVGRWIEEAIEERMTATESPPKGGNNGTTGNPHTRGRAERR